ncbi:glycoside hydrolase superfamily [Aspergillus pseudoustus]|uniref:Glycoside hydrolase superfamily n=1 Tax=Aspergillus pseudoustus TaxID=1810923 RepID=A0ABR4L4P2_9EURO
MKSAFSPILGLLALDVAAITASPVTVNISSKLQEVDGFGFSQAFVRAAEFQAADSVLQKKALDLLFSKDQGAGFSIIRNWIPSSSNFTILPESPGSPSTTPTYRWDRWDEGQLWFTKQAASYGVEKVYADAWSAPGFMKTSGREALPGYLCGTPGHDCESGDWRQAYANYLVQYVKFYQQEGLDVTHLGFLNEPDFKPDYSQMQISPNASEAISFIPILRQTIDDARLNLSITCCDATGWKKQSGFTDALVAADMQKDLGIITSHTYSSDATYPLNTSLHVWVTEAGVPRSAGGFVPTWYNTGALNEGLTWASKIATAFVDANLNAYLYWEGFEINAQESASHLIDTLGDEVLPSGVFYAFSMWSRFIRPGAHRVATTGSVPNVVTAAFENTDRSVIIVFTNSGSSSQSAQLLVPGRSSAHAWLTDNSHKVARTSVKGSGSSIEVIIPAHSVVTVKFD